ncbi:CDP-diacylglycerol--glycerol-3-phosphate 3-phosphatidyltransferase [Tomitella fengzijianii]|uniref:CDP-diacylglycerol--glycerol-3-phosphate 3-phosphatidyltransferase n=1 Tax=Tomitella fengzijianii TaxID=2597660 RepID=A0A516X3J8_9ACTN|nr:CDP-diacylglycerol--glycerol-3-phosphate 3-phosphatidyltransferase [Tomitella fengzijianii]QDQ97649.1 CDP-diacylglycerol--glycerol-3-phosphate 3-phosphatidyltransferase [Tomitella fengzijianii]
MTAEDASRPGASASRPATVPGPAGVRSEVPVVNLANMLTMLRILLVPVFLVVLFLGDGHDTAARIGAAAVFALAALTDRIDGEVARRRGLITDFGKIADPIADKALIGAALVGLSALGDLSWWITGLIAARELGVTLLRFVVIRHGVIPASRGGKLKTLVQVAAIFLYLLPLPEAASPYLLALIWVAVALTLATGADYVVQAVRLRRRGHALRAGAGGTGDTGAGERGGGAGDSGAAPGHEDVAAS